MRSLRTIASEWHSGQWSALSTFASSGHIRSDLQAEIRRTYNTIPRYRRSGITYRELRTLHRMIGEAIRIGKESETIKRSMFRG